MPPPGLSEDFSGRTVLVLGGDGFCGWPTALRFSTLGAKVSILDNGARRRIDKDLGTTPLLPICSLPERLAAWQEQTGRTIRSHEIDLATDPKALRILLAETRPDIIIHFAEQRSAPYSMMSPEAGRYTVDNNLRATHNLLAAIVEASCDPHLIHLGSLGVYGYRSAGLRLPEGYLSVRAFGTDGREAEKEVLFPGEPDSIYHMTKSLDQQLFAFYARFHGLRITDLHQGVVWCTQTKETRIDARLVNRFDHDRVYGTVVNRFMCQAVAQRPLTVFGSGTQRRGFIHICDMLRCLVFAAETPPHNGDRVRVVNQVAETCCVLHIAETIAKLTGVPIVFVDNERREPEGNELDVDNSTLRGIGFTPQCFDTGLAEEIADVKKLLRPNLQRVAAS
ncbi:NAD-dependent epimerase/dehydratase family protein [uncultured Limimaricola sp.]|uniref:NAD-dependent epimerase/dehydratase family protein n=1 Tax=uncultured Limimaricola sp. TaxID=2211667 RepID=UPI0030F73534